MLIRSRVSLLCLQQLSKKLDKYIEELIPDLKISKAVEPGAPVPPIYECWRMDNLARLAGIAVDYLIMAVIRLRNPSVITSSCMAEEALRYVYSDWDVSDVEQRNMADEEGMVRHVEGADMRPFASRMGEIHDSTKKAYQDFLRSDVTDSPRELAWAFVRLSQ